jgi:hypothetical protein
VQHIADSKQASGQIHKADKLLPIAGELGCSLAQLALAWCLRNKHVSTVITGATKVQQVGRRQAGRLAGQRLGQPASQRAGCAGPSHALPAACNAGRVAQARLHHCCTTTPCLPH